MGLLDLFGFGKRRKMILELIDNGAVIVDVRSQGEFNMGNVKGSINVPLDSLKHKAPKLKKLNKPLVLICQSGARSGMGVRMLRSGGIECYNGGGWRRLLS